MHYGYLFETRGIQRFLFASGKLRDMLGGSELLDYLCTENGLLDQSLKGLELHPRIARKAGGAFYLLFDRLEDAQRLRAAWRLACARWIPGVEQVDALSEGRTAKGAIANGLKALHAARNRLKAELPRPGPLSERSPRTGLAGIAHANGESLDAATARQRSFARPDDGNTLTQRFLDDTNYRWPINFESSAREQERFPLGERSLVGLLHADGNGLGELLRVLNDACKNANDDIYIGLYRTFSQGLEQATLAAAREASRKVLVPEATERFKVLPGRPLVLGGDDVTILLRADVALPFAKAFLHAFETHTGKSMQALREHFKQAGLGEEAGKLPAFLTACAGLCYMKHSQPFQAGHDLAESLCKRAKGVARKARRSEEEPVPSTLAFHKVQDSLLEDAESQFINNHVVSTEGHALHLALPAYALRDGYRLPTLDDLEILLSIYEPSPNGDRLNDRPLREIATLVRSDRTVARQAYTRWRELASRHQPDRLTAFDNALGKLLGDVETDLPASNLASNGVRHSPLSDLLTLLTVRGSSQHLGEN